MSRYFTEEHEWVEVEGKIATVGITEYAQQQLGDVVFVDVPSEGKSFDKGDEAAVVDPHLRVRGVSGLRVADAAVMPRLISGNTNAAAMMIGEKAADMIRSGQ